MSTIAVFDGQGKCKYVVNAQDNSLDFSDEPAFAEVPDSTDPNKIWFDHTASTVNPRTPLVVRVSANKIEGVPSGTLAYVGSDSMVIEGGVLELEVDYPQIVQVLLTHVRHIEKVVEVPCEVQS